MWVAIGASLLGLLIVILAIGIPFWASHRRMRSKSDPGEVRAYQEATGRSGEAIAAGKPGQPFWRGGKAARRWQAVQAEDHATRTGQQPEHSEERGQAGPES